jgi:hypothetical protein
MTTVQAGSDQNERTYVKNNQSKKSWGHDSSGRAPAKQMQDPEFKLQNSQKYLGELQSIKIFIDYSLCVHVS